MPIAIYSLLTMTGEKPSLDDILERGASVGGDEDVLMADGDHEAPEDFCVECTDMPFEVRCVECDEQFCKVCWAVVHRTGKRKQHTVEEVKSNAAEAVPSTTPAPDALESESEAETDTNTPAPAMPSEELLARLATHAKYIPMRLTADERQLLRLLEASLNVSEYTDKIDILSYLLKLKRIVAEIKEICSILAGLVVASDFKAGQTLVVDKAFGDNAGWYQAIFEIGRRYKIMNPEKMRDSFGKLCYIVMDLRLPEVRDALEFDLYRPIKTVHGFLLLRADLGKALGLLQDPLLLDAVAEINTSGLSRPQIQQMIKAKELAIARLAERYGLPRPSRAQRYTLLFLLIVHQSTPETPEGFTQDEIRQVLYSMGDVNAYVRANRAPINRMLQRLEKFEQEEKHYLLGIRMGVNGARLLHSHHKQYHFCHQLMTLWLILMRDFIHLWLLADDDLLGEHRYRLADTGQGLQRLKAAPQVARAMHRVLAEVQRKLAVGFVGSLAVHIGDAAVPSALTYLDKYLQVPRILIPVDHCLTKLGELYRKDRFVAQAIDAEYGLVEHLEKTILADFFRHAFDGSGGEDYFMAGLCVDGRLTLAWNWANNIAKKNYYKFFLLTEFIGFNGTDGW